MTLDLTNNYSHGICLCSQDNVGIIDFRIIMKHWEINWNYSCTLGWVNVDWNYIENNPDKPWNYMMLSRLNPPRGFIIRHKNKPWDFDYITKNERKVHKQ